MKKTLIIVFSLALIIGLTGCGGKNEVTCTMIDTRSAGSFSMTMKYEIRGIYDPDDKIVDVFGSVSADLSEISEYADQICEMLESQFPNASVECSKKDVEVSEFLTEEQKENAIGQTLADFKTSIEGNGFTCK